VLELELEPVPVHVELSASSSCVSPHDPYLYQAFLFTYVCSRKQYEKKGLITCLSGLYTDHRYVTYWFYITDIERLSYNRLTKRWVWISTAHKYWSRQHRKYANIKLTSLNKIYSTRNTYTIYGTHISLLMYFIYGLEKKFIITYLNSFPYLKENVHIWNYLQARCKICVYRNRKKINERKKRNTYIMYKWKTWNSWR